MLILNQPERFVDAGRISQLWFHVGVAKGKVHSSLLETQRSKIRLLLPQGLRWNIPISSGGELGYPHDLGNRHRLS